MLSLQSKIIKWCSPDQLQALLQNDAKFAIIFPEEDLWKEKCFLDFGLPASFFDLVACLSPKDRYLQIRSYYLPDVHKQDTKEFDSPVFMSPQGQERDFMLHDAVESGRIDLVNQALIFLCPNLPANFNIENHVEKRVFDPSLDRIRPKKLPKQLRNILLSSEDVLLDVEGILQCALASFNLTILDFFLALYGDNIRFGLEDFVLEYMKSRNLHVAYSILQRIKHRIRREEMSTLSETRNIDLFLLVAKELHKRSPSTEMQRIYQMCSKIGMFHTPS